MKLLLTGTVRGEGGIQYHMRFFIRALDELGHEVLCISAHPHGGDPAKEKPIQDEFPFPISDRIRIVETTHSSAFDKMKLYRKLLKEFSPDMLITTGHGMGNFMLAALTPKRIPRVYFEVMVTNHLLKMTNPRRHYKSVYSHFIAQSYTVGLKLQKEMNRKVPYTSICAFPQIHQDLAPLPEVHERSYEKGKLKACYFGRLINYKRPQLLAEVFGEVEDLVGEYHVFGAGPEEETIRNLASSQGFENRITCHGRYPNGTEYYELLEEFDFLVLPTIGPEGSPLVLLESLACGVPYVSCDTGGIRDYLYPEGHCMVVGPSKDDFVKGIRKLCENLIAGKVTRKSLQESYQKNYSFNACKKNWNDEINRIAEAQ